jgi:hypothetical protein
MPPKTFTLSPILSTHRQLMRCSDWWTKANGFFEQRDKDLVGEALALARLLGESNTGPDSKSQKAAMPAIRRCGG